MSEDDDLEIEISEAKKIDPTFEVGEEFTPGNSSCTVRKKKYSYIKTNPGN